jgi:hypothetical protein
VPPTGLLLKFTDSPKQMLVLLVKIEVCNNVGVVMVADTVEVQPILSVAVIV